MFKSAAQLRMHWRTPPRPQLHPSYGFPPRLRSSRRRSGTRCGSSLSTPCRRRTGGTHSWSFRLASYQINTSFSKFLRASNRYCRVPEKMEMRLMSVSMLLKSLTFYKQTFLRQIVKFDELLQIWVPVESPSSTSDVHR